MPTFTVTALPAPIPPGIHLAKIVRAVEKLSSNDHEMIIMTLELPPPDRQRLPCVITFVAGAHKLISALCLSAGLTLPADGAEADLRAEHLCGRYVYIRVEADETGAPRVTRFLERSVAVGINPAIAQIKIQPQSPVTLPVVQKPSL